MFDRVRKSLEASYARPHNVIERHEIFFIGVISLRTKHTVCINRLKR